MQCTCICHASLRLSSIYALFVRYLSQQLNESNSCVGMSWYFLSVLNVLCSSGSSMHLVCRMVSNAYAPGTNLFLGSTLRDHVIWNDVLPFCLLPLCVLKAVQRSYLLNDSTCCQAGRFEGHSQMPVP